MIIIFKNENKIYVRYNKIYLLKETGNTFSFQPLEEDNIKQKKNSLVLNDQPLPTPNIDPKYAKITFQDYLKKKKYNGKCFCYLVITKKNLQDFYNYWC